MSVGPVQLIVLGFRPPRFHGEIIAELERLRESGTVRVIYALADYKDADGEIEVEHLRNLTQKEAIELDTKVGALLGPGIEGGKGMTSGAEQAVTIMATDLARTPTAGVAVQLCGDAHLSNLGRYAAPERHLLYDLSDFDETLPGPFEYDLKCMAASFTIAGRHNAFAPNPGACRCCGRAHPQS